MSEHGYQPPSIRNIITGIALFVALLFLICSLSPLLKLAGNVFLYIPYALGAVDLVFGDEVQTTSLAAPPTVVDFARPGSYAVYTADYDLLVITDSLLEAQAPSWLRVRPESGGKDIPVLFVDRGLRPYDTPAAGGRPIFTFEIGKSGSYILIHPARKAIISIVPDYTTGKEPIIVLAYFLQLAIIAGMVAILYLRHYRVRKARLDELRGDSPDRRRRAEAFWQKETGRKKEDQANLSSFDSKRDR